MRPIVKGYINPNVVKGVHSHKCDHCGLIFVHIGSKDKHICIFCKKVTSTTIYQK